MDSPYKNFAIIIPARLNSSRLPQKMLADLNGKPILQHVFNRCLESKLIKNVWIATDSAQIAKVAKSFTAKIIITSNKHLSGTSRIFEAANMLLGIDYIINVQGDEVFIDPDLIDKLAIALKNNKEKAVSAAYFSDDTDEINSPSTAKIVLDKDENALYFSRSPIPFRSHGNRSKNEKYLLHIGIYGYTKEFLKAYNSWPVSSLETQESLEQLRILYYGFKIKIVSHKKLLGLAIDTKKDLEKARLILTQINNKI